MQAGNAELGKQSQQFVTPHKEYVPWAGEASLGSSA